MRLLNEAKEVLLDPDLRAAYDRSRRQSSRRPPTPVYSNAPGWIPADSVKDHNGDDLSSELDFFFPPPTEIGNVITAHSTMKRDDHPVDGGVRVWVVIGAIAMGILAAFVITKIFGIETAFWIGAWYLVMSGIAFACAMEATEFRHKCTYVGCDGVARFECNGTRTSINLSNVFRFQTAAYLDHKIDHHQKNGTYSHTEYYLAWYDIGRRQVFAIFGKHLSQTNQPPKEDNFNFAVSAATAWDAFVQRRSDQ